VVGSIAAGSDWSIFDENSWLGVRGLLAVAVCGLIGRLVLQVGRIRFRRPPLSAFALAYLAGGPARVTLAALAGLRAQGCIAVTGHPGGAVLEAAAPPPYADPVEFAVFHAVSVGIPPERLSQAPAVAHAIAPCVDQLRRDGLLLTPSRRRAARIIGVVGGIGATLVGTIVFFVGLALLFTPVSERTFVSRRVLARRRRRYPLDRGWPQRRPDVARMTVALHGDAAMLAGDPGLARGLGIRQAQPAPAGRGFDDSGSSDSGDGGGDGGGGD
jgi:hypothetical protein